MGTPEDQNPRLNQPTLTSPTLYQAFLFWMKLGFISFGGPTGQVAIMHKELVEKKKWIEEERFLHALNFCMLLPGPEAQQLAIYLGWLLHRTWGGILAGVLFVLPASILLWLLSYLYVIGQQSEILTGIFWGLKPAVLAIVISAGIRIGKRSLKTYQLFTISLLAFIAIFFFELPFPLIVLAAAILGITSSKFFAKEDSKDTFVCSSDIPLSHSLYRSIAVTLVGLVAWWLPVIVIGNSLGWHGVHTQQALFFSKAALVTFGGAYAVLPYVAQEAVSRFGWLSPTQMLDGLALAETTPGPLIMVLQFVGFIGGWNSPPAGFSPLLSATLSAAITTWVTFTPCFLWIFLGAPYVERIRKNRTISAALSAVTAAVVGVIFNLVLWFGWHTLVSSQGVDSLAIPVGSLRYQLNLFALLAVVLGLIAIEKFKLNVVLVICLFACLGVFIKAV